MQINKLTPKYLAARREEEKRLFPGSHYGAFSAMPKGLDVEFETALQAGSEESIQRVLTANPYLLQYAVPDSGHHGIWAFPKRMIRTQRADSIPGLIPDYLIATANSLGYIWNIVELKRSDTQFANKKGDSLSSAGLKAVVQCATYHAHFNQYIETVRSNVGIDDIIQPDNVIVIIGDSTTESEEQRKRRDEFCQLAPKVKIVTYDRLRRGLAHDLSLRGKK